MRDATAICILGLLGGLLLVACGGSADSPSAPSASMALPSATELPGDVVGPSGHFRDVQVSADGTRHLIPLDEIRHGGPPKDGIPSIDAPRFARADEWDTLGYRGDGLVIGVEVDGVRRAYPFQILVWHEIVNDVVNGQPLLITYCPLCGTGIVFEPLVGGEPVEFGVSGKLYNSDLLMYDRATDTLWSQLTGTAVVGERAGERLPLYPSEMMTWDEWRATWPDSEVLTRDTGYLRDYDDPPYEGYEDDESIWFPVRGRDDRLHPKTPVTGIELDASTFGAWPDDLVIEHGPVNDTLGTTALLVVADPGAGETIRVFERSVDGRTLSFRRNGDALIDAETGTRWSFTGVATDGELRGSHLRALVPIRGFWFAWYAFHPTTALWTGE